MLMYLSDPKGRSVLEYTQADIESFLPFVSVVQWCKEPSYRQAQHSQEDRALMARFDILANTFGDRSQRRENGLHNVALFSDRKAPTFREAVNMASVDCRPELAPGNRGVH